jgi:hypothetical protein
MRGFRVIHPISSLIAKKTMLRSSFLTLTVVVIGGLATGCDSTPEGRLRVYDAYGKVMVDGKPAEGAKVVLYGATPDLQGPGTVAPYGVVDANGQFELTSYDLNDGAPAGSYQVSIFWPEPIPAGADEEMYQPKDLLKDRYANPEKSGITAEVPEGGGELPLMELKK